MSFLRNPKKKPGHLPLTVNQEKGENSIYTNNRDKKINHNIECLILNTLEIPVESQYKEINQERVKPRICEEIGIKK